MSKMTSWHVGVAGEAFAAAQFARYAYDVSVQYGANQPEYDLIAVSGEKMLKISVKGSQDGSWGLTQSLKKGRTYHEAVQAWLNKHHKKTIFCLVQFKNTTDFQMSRMYLASPREIAEQLCGEAGGRGDTILYEYHEWGPTAAAYGTVDKLPDEWLFTEARAKEMFDRYGL
ncbi:MAG: hypothetical protein J6J43_08395 [Oscillospiraceae bacterium]|nr:hypothetical protein [Oscillospiraceae bacterium]